MNDPHYHGAVTESRILRLAIEDRGRGLVQDCSRGLIYLGGNWRIAGRRRLRKIRDFSTIGLISSEVVSRKKYSLQGRVIWIDPRVYVCDDAAPGDLKGVLSLCNTNDLCRRLVCVAGPNRCPKICDWSTVRQSTWNSRQLVLAPNKGKHLIQFGVQDAWGCIQNVKQKIRINQVWSC